MEERRNERGAISGLVIGALIAAALIAVPLVLMTRMQTESAEQATGTVAKAKDAKAQLDLTSAIQAARVYFSEHGTYEGFGPAAAASLEPGIRFNSAGRAVRGEVSIRGVTRTTVVLVTRAGPNAVLCSAAETATVTTGRTDASSAAECTGGW